MVNAKVKVINQQELAARLRRAREASGLTQDEVARFLGVSRSAVAQIEAGKRKVDSVELGILARLFGRSPADFLASEFEEDGSSVILRVFKDMDLDSMARKELLRYLEIVREIVNLEKILGIERVRTILPQYQIEPPKGKWEAVREGIVLAQKERQRLNLGTDPVGDMAAVLERQGIIVLQMELPDAVSGFTYRYGKHVICAVNSRQHWSRQRFSLAHEMCHALCDIHTVSGIVSKTDAEDDLREKRANSFANEFLMPEEGVKLYAEEILGRIPSTFRIDDEIFRRPIEASDITIFELNELAQYFGVSREAMRWKLLNLKIIDRKIFKELEEQEDPVFGPQLRRKIFGNEKSERPDITEHHAETRLFNLAYKALKKGEISERKFIEISRLLGLNESDIAEFLKFLSKEDENSR